MRAAKPGKMRSKMKSSGKPLQRAIILTLLFFCLAGCGVLGGKSHVLRDREEITPHPTDPAKVCLDKGYLTEIFEEMKRE